MRTHSIAAVALTSALLAAGCSGFLSKRNPPAGPSFERAKAPGPRADAALLYVFRHRAEPIHEPATLVLDGSKVAKLSHWGFTWLYARPGTRSLGVRWDQLTGQLPADLTLKLEAGQAYYVELTSVDRTTANGRTRRSDLTLWPLFDVRQKLEACGYQEAVSEVAIP